MSERRADLTTYFDSELAYLLEMGAEFAAAHPESAHLLSGTGNDPSVERLLQGVAFLTARIRKRLDDELPEIAQPILRMLWPGFLRPLPSITMQQFQARPGDQDTLNVRQGSRVRSQPVRLDDTTPKMPVEFCTAYDVVVPPLRISKVSVTAGGRYGTLYITLSMGDGLTFANLKEAPGPLRVHVADNDLSFASTTTYHLVHAQLDAPPPELHVGPARIRLPRLTPVGFEPSEALMAGWGDDDGYRILQEYFAFPDKFLFFDAHGLEAVMAHPDQQECTLVIPFGRTFSEASRLRVTNFQLGCTPAVNWFELTSNPITRPPQQPEYRVLPSGRTHEALEVIEVLDVHGIRQGQRGKTPYVTYQEAVARHEVDDAPWYDVRMRLDTGGRLSATWLVLSPPRNPNQDERLSARLICGNGLLPSSLRAGDVSEGASGIPTGARTRNLTTPSTTLPPPLGGELLWKLIGHVASVESTLSDVSSLRSVLGLYNFRLNVGEARDREVHRRRMEALERMEVRPADLLVPVSHLSAPGTRVHPAARVACRGAEITLTVHTRQLEGVGQAWLLGSALDHFLAQRASLNAFSRLVLVDQAGSHEELRWPARLGKRPLI